MRFIVALLLFVVACNAAPLLHAKNPTAINGSYIVVLKSSDLTARDAHITALRQSMAAANDGSSVGFVYGILDFVGFSAFLSDSLLNAELAHPDVDYVEADQVMTASYLSQTNAVWGLARISSIKNIGGSLYKYNSTAGKGVDVYVIDTGIYTANQDFGGRASSVFTAFPGDTTDGNGHGTHCAGTIGGTAYGVAKGVSLKAVKVLGKDGSGTNAGVIAGVDHVTNKRDKTRPAVASMSLGGGISTALDNAVTKSIASGVVYAVAAGNENQDACNCSPARVPTAITVGATDSADKKATFSNWGNCVDIFAPGVSIKSDWIGSPTATNTISGTSMATPHVSGVLALHLSSISSPLSFSPSSSSSWVEGVATQGIVQNPMSAKNFLLFSPAA